MQDSKTSQLFRWRNSLGLRGVLLLVQVWQEWGGEGIMVFLVTSFALYSNELSCFCRLLLFVLAELLGKTGQPIVNGGMSYLQSSGNLP